MARSALFKRVEFAMKPGQSLVILYNVRRGGDSGIIKKRSKDQLKTFLMAKEVIKRGGRHQPFRAEKIRRSIRMASRDARIPRRRIKTVVSKVSGPVLKFARKRKIVKTSVLRSKVVSRLRRVEPAAAKAWVRYESKKRRRSRSKR